MSAPLGQCPDCGQEYKDPEQILPPVSEVVIGESIPWSQYAAELHRDIECPVQKERDLKERDLVAGLEAALRYFGIADTLAKLGELMSGENEHDAGLIWGDGERWLKREREQCEEQKRSGGIGTPPGIAVHPPTPANGGYANYPQFGDARCGLSLVVPKEGGRDDSVNDGSASGGDK